ncbi:hypothetical protein [Ruminococcus callidus]
MQQYSNRPPFMGPEYHYDLRALIFGIVSFLFCQLPVLSVVTGIVALVYAARAKKRQWNYSRGMRRCGIILGIVGIIVCVLFSIYWGITILRTVIMLYEENQMVPAPPNPQFFEGPGTPAVIYGTIAQSLSDGFARDLHHFL